MVYLRQQLVPERSLPNMKFVKSKMKILVKENEELKKRLRDLMDELDIDKDAALRAMYHSDVEGGKYQVPYQQL